MAKNDDQRELRCSFCGKMQNQVQRLIAGPGVCICNECVELCQSVLDDDAREERIRKIVDAIVRRGTCHIGNEEFEELCRQEGLRAEDFDQSDIDEIQRRLDRY